MIANYVKQQIKINSQIYHIHVHTAEFLSTTIKSTDIAKHGEGVLIIRWTSPNKPPLKRGGLRVLTSDSIIIGSKASLDDPPT